MSLDYNAAQESFNEVLCKLHPWVLSNFIMWLDLKIAEYKVFGLIVTGTYNYYLPFFCVFCNSSRTLLYIHFKLECVQRTISLTPIVHKATDTVNQLIRRKRNLQVGELDFRPKSSSYLKFSFQRPFIWDCLSHF